MFCCCMLVLLYMYVVRWWFFLSLLAGVWSWFGSQSSDEDDSSLLANQSLLLLLVLVNHCTQGKKKQNPYRHALFAFKNRKVKGMAPLFICLSLILLTYMPYSMVGLYCRDYPGTNNSPHVWFAPSTRIFHVKAVYMVLGSSCLSARKILALGTSTTFCMWTE